MSKFLTTCDMCFGVCGSGDIVTGWSPCLRCQGTGVVERCDQEHPVDGRRCVFLPNHDGFHQTTTPAEMWTQSVPSPVGARPVFFSLIHNPDSGYNATCDICRVEFNLRLVKHRGDLMFQQSDMISFFKQIDAHACSHKESGCDDGSAT